MIASLYTHTQVYYCRASLTTKIKLQVLEYVYLCQLTTCLAKCSFGSFFT